MEETLMQPLPSLSPQQANHIAQLMGLETGVHVTEVTHQHNHVWQLCDGQNVYFLKTFTKVWYGDDVPGTAFCVKHEQDAYACLAAHGLSIPEIVLVRPDCDNPLGRPFIVTQKLKGESLMTLLATANDHQLQICLKKQGSICVVCMRSVLLFPDSSSMADLLHPPMKPTGNTRPGPSKKTNKQHSLA
jgi:hypothetical protein